MLTKEFILAGNAIFTVSNGTGTHYTFRVRRKDNDAPRLPVYFVSLLTGLDNTRDYSYIGVLSEYTGLTRLTNASKMTDSATSFRVLNWALKKVWAGESLPEGYTIQHAGRCGRCGRTLTTPESITTGIGPICAEKLMGVS
jgi:hypothetical protein